MTVGCLGDIVFEVSSKTVKTISNMKYSGSANYSTHQRHTGSALTEFVGLDAEKISFDIILSAYLGVDPAEDLEKILEYERNAQILPLVIGNKSYGRYRWVILNHDITMNTFDGGGNLMSANVSLSLQEYSRI